MRTKYEVLSHLYQQLARATRAKDKKQLTAAILQLEKELAQ